MHETANLDPHMLQLLWQGLNSIHSQYQIDDQYDAYPAVFQQMFLDQQRIGWEQLFYSRIANSWSFFIDHHSSNHHSGTIFYSQIIAKTWTYILETWRIRNEALHPKQPMLQTIQSLAPQVQHVFTTIQQDPELQQYEPQATPAKILQRPIRAIRTFLETSNRQIRTQATAAQAQAIAKTKDIRTFFRNLIPKNDTHPP